MKRDESLERIAKTYLDLDSLKAVGVHDADYTSHSVDALKRALTAAYDFGAVMGSRLQDARAEAESYGWEIVWETDETGVDRLAVVDRKTGDEIWDDFRHKNISKITFEMEALSELLLEAASQIATCEDGD